MKNENLPIPIISKKGSRYYKTAAHREAIARAHIGSKRTKEEKRNISLGIARSKIKWLIGSKD
jgi:hypothetical protein